ncbi:hypothetical protein ACP275_10G158000 [Erythranthe tilingii]
MDKGKQEFSDIQEWITHLLPDNSADFGIVKEEGVSMPSSSLSNPNPNQQNKPFPANTTNINPSMWQNSMRRNLENPNHSSGRQNIGTSNNLQGFSHNPSSANAVSDLHQQQHQLLQNRGQNIFQLPMQSNNNYPSYARQQHKQVQVSPMVKHHHQETFNVLQHNNNQTTFLKSLERQSGFHLPQNFTMNDQLKLGNHSQNARVTPFQVPESTPQMMSTNTVDWVDQACHKILQMKEHYLAEVTKIYHKSTEAIRHATTTEQLSKGQYAKESSQRMIKFLHCTRLDISRLPKEKVCNYISRCVKFINTARSWFPEVQVTPMQQRLNPETPILNPSSTMVNSVQYSPMRSAPPQMWAPHGNNLSKMLHSSNNNNNSNNNTNLGINSQKIAMRNMLDYSVGATNKQQDLSSSAARMKTKQPMQQLRRFVGLNQKTVSPQNSQNSSKLSISATPSTCSSPLALPSPLSTPLMADSGKSPFSIEESSKFPEVSPSPVVEPPLPNNNNNNNNINITELDITTEALGLAKSKCVERESTCLSKENESRRDEKEPMKHLVDVLKSVSTGTLTAALTEIKGVVALNDAIGGQLVLGQPMKVIFHDLGDDISNFVNGNSRLVDKTCTEYSKMKRKLDGVASNETPNETGFFSSENRMIKRPRKELVMDVLMEEINEINQALIEMMVDVKNAGDEGGAHVRFSYTPVGFSRNIPNLLLDLIVSADYPNSSPTVSESMPIGCGDECMWKKAKSNFGLSIKKISEPVSIKEMARAWDFCAREVFHEFAKKTGGGNFSSKYGNWENCAVAAV